MGIKRSFINFVSITAVIAALFACSSGNDNGSAPVVDSKGNHDGNWVTQHQTFARAAISSCTECHGSDLSGGISRTSCTSASPVKGFSCHFTSPEVAPTGCTSCHGGLPNGPTGTDAPNRQFSHYTHTSLPNMTCAACHTGLGSGTAHHGDGTQVVNLSPVFRAKTVTTTFSNNAVSGTCAGISCHGGKITPSWRGGTITMATGCLSCHEAGTAPVLPDTTPTPQYNSFYSGLHLFHMNPAAISEVSSFTDTIYCTDCHRISALTDPQKHFSGLVTRSFTAPGNTIGGLPTRIGSYDLADRKCSGVTCHSFVPQDNVHWD